MTKTTLLAILQQSEYSSKQLQDWVIAHGNDHLEIEPPKWTFKLKLINLLSSVFFFLPNLTAILMTLTLITPFETLLRWGIYLVASLKLAWLKSQGLNVVAIAGSYAKTSTKHILFHTFSESISTLMTPHSYNTLLGIAQVILKDLEPQHKLFIVEFGEYHPEDIPHLTRFIQPKWGILTPIGRQHLSIIGGFDEVINTFKTFVSHFTDHPDNLLSAESNRQYFPQKKTGFYGDEATSEYQVSKAIITRAGTEFDFVKKNSDQPHPVFTPLFGEHQAINALTAFWLATKLQLPTTEVIKRLRTMPYIHRRHEPTFAENDVLILDNSYNTNAESIKDSLKLLNQLEPTHRIIITLGFTELGDQANQVHQELGALLAKKVDYVGLIKAPWSQSIIDGFIQAGGQESHIIVGTTQETALAQVQSHITPGSVVLFEGGYQEVYV
jgi:UDP-N-acetylmuramoyl-tripeptide--D-alanyl-D-alanine ligase